MMQSGTGNADSFSFPAERFAGTAVNAAISGTTKTTICHK
jgi:hypothetical protein